MNKKTKKSSKYNMLKANNNELLMSIYALKCFHIYICVCKCYDIEAITVVYLVEMLCYFLFCQYCMILWILQADTCMSLSIPSQSLLYCISFVDTVKYLGTSISVPWCCCRIISYCRWKKKKKIESSCLVSLSLSSHM